MQAYAGPPTAIEVAAIGAVGRAAHVRAQMDALDSSVIQLTFLEYENLRKHFKTFPALAGLCQPERSTGIRLNGHLHTIEVDSSHVLHKVADQLSRRLLHRELHRFYDGSKYLPAMTIMANPSEISLLIDLWSERARGGLRVPQHLIYGVYEGGWDKMRAEFCSGPQQYNITSEIKHAVESVLAALRRGVNRIVHKRFNGYNVHFLPIDIRKPRPVIIANQQLNVELFIGHHVAYYSDQAEFGQFLRVVGGPLNTTSLNLMLLPQQLIRYAVDDKYTPRGQFVDEELGYRMNLCQERGKDYLLFEPMAAVANAASHPYTCLRKDWLSWTLGAAPVGAPLTFDDIWTYEKVKVKCLKCNEFISSEFMQALPSFPSYVVKSTLSSNAELLIANTFGRGQLWFVPNFIEYADPSRYATPMDYMLHTGMFLPESLLTVIRPVQVPIEGTKVDYNRLVENARIALTTRVSIMSVVGRASEDAQLTLARMFTPSEREILANYIATNSLRLHRKGVWILHSSTPKFWTIKFWRTWRWMANRFSPYDVFWSLFDKTHVQSAELLKQRSVGQVRDLTDYDSGAFPLTFEFIKLCSVQQRNLHVNALNLNGAGNGVFWIRGTNATRDELQPFFAQPPTSFVPSVNRTTAIRPELPLVNNHNHTYALQRNELIAYHTWRPIFTDKVVKELFENVSGTFIAGSFEDMYVFAREADLLGRKRIVRTSMHFQRDYDGTCSDNFMLDFFAQTNTNVTSRFLHMIILQNKSHFAGYEYNGNILFASGEGWFISLENNHVKYTFLKWPFQPIGTKVQPINVNVSNFKLPKIKLSCSSFCKKSRYATMSTDEEPQSEEEWMTPEEQMEMADMDTLQEQEVKPILKKNWVCLSRASVREEAPIGLPGGVKLRMLYEQYEMPYIVCIGSAPGQQLIEIANQKPHCEYICFDPREMKGDLPDNMTFIQEPFSYSKHKRLLPPADQTVVIDDVYVQENVNSWDPQEILDHYEPAIYDCKFVESNMRRVRVAGVYALLNEIGVADELRAILASGLYHFQRKRTQNLFNYVKEIRLGRTCAFTLGSIPDIDDLMRWAKLEDKSDTWADEVPIEEVIEQQVVEDVVVDLLVEGEPIDTLIQEEHEEADQPWEDLPPPEAMIEETVENIAVDLAPLPAGVQQRKVVAPPLVERAQLDNSPIEPKPAPAVPIDIRKVESISPEAGLRQIIEHFRAKPGATINVGLQTKEGKNGGKMVVLANRIAAQQAFFDWMNAYRNQNIWRFNNDSLAEGFARIEEFANKFEAAKQSNNKPWSVLRNTSLLLLHGGPGTGKTSFLHDRVTMRLPQVVIVTSSRNLMEEIARNHNMQSCVFTPEIAFAMPTEAPIMFFDEALQIGLPKIILMCMILRPKVVLLGGDIAQLGSFDGDMKQQNEVYNYVEALEGIDHVNLTTTYRCDSHAASLYNAVTESLNHPLHKPLQSVDTKSTLHWSYEVALADVEGVIQKLEIDPNGEKFPLVICNSRQMVDAINKRFSEVNTRRNFEIANTIATSQGMNVTSKLVAQRKISKVVILLTDGLAAIPDNVGVGKYLEAGKPFDPSLAVAFTRISKDAAIKVQIIAIGSAAPLRLAQYAPLAALSQEEQLPKKKSNKRVKGRTQLQVDPVIHARTTVDGNLVLTQSKFHDEQARNDVVTVKTKHFDRTIDPVALAPHYTLRTRVGNLSERVHLTKEVIKEYALTVADDHRGHEGITTERGEGVSIDLSVVIATTASKAQPRIKIESLADKLKTIENPRRVKLLNPKGFPLPAAIQSPTDVPFSVVGFLKRSFKSQTKEIMYTPSQLKELAIEVVNHIFERPGWKEHAQNIETYFRSFENLNRAMMQASIKTDFINGEEQAVDNKKEIEPEMIELNDCPYVAMALAKFQVKPKNDKLDGGQGVFAHNQARTKIPEFNSTIYRAYTTAMYHLFSEDLTCPAIAGGELSNAVADFFKKWRPEHSIIQTDVSQKDSSYSDLEFEVLVEMGKRCGMHEPTVRKMFKTITDETIVNADLCSMKFKTQYQLLSGELLTLLLNTLTTWIQVYMNTEFIIDAQTLALIKTGNFVHAMVVGDDASTITKEKLETTPEQSTFIGPNVDFWTNLGMKGKTSTIGQGVAFTEFCNHFCTPGEVYINPKRLFVKTLCKHFPSFQPGEKTKKIRAKVYEEITTWRMSLQTHLFKMSEFKNPIPPLYLLQVNPEHIRFMNSVAALESHILYTLMDEVDIIRAHAEAIEILAREP